MTPQEQDAATRSLRDRLGRVKADTSAILSELWQHRDACEKVIGLVDGVRGDVGLRIASVSVPELPTTERVERLFADLRAATNEEAECLTRLREAGFPV